MWISFRNLVDFYQFNANSKFLACHLCFYHPNRYRLSYACLFLFLFLCLCLWEERRWDVESRCRNDFFPALPDECVTLSVNSGMRMKMRSKFPRQRTRKHNKKTNQHHKPNHKKKVGVVMKKRQPCRVPSNSLVSLHYHVKTTHGRCESFSLVVLCQRWGRVTTSRLPSKASPNFFSCIAGRVRDIVGQQRDENENEIKIP